MVVKKRKKRKVVKKEKVLDTIKEKVKEMKIEEINEEQKKSAGNEETAGNQSAPVTLRIKKITLWKFATFILAAIVVIQIFAFENSFTSCKCNEIDNTNLSNTQDYVVQENVNLENGGTTLGKTDADVSFVVFSDFQCPFSKRLYTDVYTKLKTTFIKDDKVSFIYRDFPLPGHGMAMPSSIAARCAKEKGGNAAFWKMHDKIFDNQEDISVENLKKWAKDMGYDISSCMDSNKFNEDILKDYNEGSELGVQGTPTSFINGKIINGACPYATFEKVINAELEGKNWTVNKCIATVE